MSIISNAQNNSSSSSNVDPWSFSSNTKTFGTRHGRPSKATKHIPDAWDDDDDDDAGEEEDNAVAVDSAAVWDDANTRQPMPEVILTTSSTSSSSAPPPEALQQPMRILKRPSASSCSTSSSSISISSINSPGIGGAITLKDREAAYQAARARIFGAEGKSKDAGGSDTKERIDLREAQERLKSVTLDSPSSKLGTSSNVTHGQTVSAIASSVIRNPFGPPSGASSSTANGTGSSASDRARVDQKGFIKRRGGSAGVGGRTHVAGGSIDGARPMPPNAKS